MTANSPARTPIRRVTRTFTSVMLLFTSMPAVHAGTLELGVVDAQGLPLEHAVVSLHDDAPAPILPEQRKELSLAAARTSAPVLSLQLGTSVEIENAARLRHELHARIGGVVIERHVYPDQPVLPIRFDTPGIVTLNCRIHNRAEAHLVVLDTHLSGETSPDGKARIEELPSGDYTMQVWHPRLGDAPLRQPLSLGEGDSSLAIELETPIGSQRSELDEALHSLLHD